MKKKQIPVKTILAVDFLQGYKCARCGIWGDKKVCNECKVLKVCPICEYILRSDSYYFYEYEYVEPQDALAFFREKKKLKYNPYTHDGTTCTECKDYKLKIKNTCFLCEDTFKNSPLNFRKYGNLCKDCSGENAEDIIKDTIIEESYFLTI